VWLHDYIVAHTGEDGAFYLQIAKNIAQGQGATFDGVHPTTGMHWGWVLLLAGWLRLWGGDFEPAAALYFICLFIAAWLTSLSIGGRNGALAAVFLVLLLGSRGQWLMESHLVMAMLAAFYLMPAAITGFALVMCRIDLLILVAIVSIFLRMPRPLIGGICAALMVSLLNWYVDGHFLAVSGALKAGYGWNDWSAIWDNIRLVNEYYFPTLQITVLGACLYWRKRGNDVLVSGFIACLLMLSLYILKDRAMGGWYLAPLLLTTVIMAGRMIGDTHWTFEGFVAPIKAATKPTDRIFMEDLSGKLAITTGRRFLSGDGLVNSWAYLDNYLRPGRVAEYLKDNADYFLTSNIRCDDSKRMAWSRDVVRQDGNYILRFDLSYLTNMGLPVQYLELPEESLVFDICSGGYRELLFRTHPTPEVRGKAGVNVFGKLSPAGK
jgi:hypothetical protein